MLLQILDSCDPTGTCRAECPAAVEEVRAENNCFRSPWGYLRYLYMTFLKDIRLVKFAAAMESCGGRHSGAWTTTTEPSVMTTKAYG